MDERTKQISLTFYYCSNDCSETATMDINLGVLEAAHSILSQWHSRTRSDAFWLIIKPVHSKFLVPYYPLFEMIIEFSWRRQIPCADHDSTHRPILRPYMSKTLPQSSRTAMRGSPRRDRLLHATHGVGPATAPDRGTSSLPRSACALSHF